MPLKTKRWDDPTETDDGFRLLITRYRPRGLPKGDETWDAWWKDLAPSAELLAAFHGKAGPPLSWPAYRRRYQAEQRGQTRAISALAERIVHGETITLLCSSACTDPERCHRTILASLILEAAGRRKIA
jgi:uncharacterized protein YeaO (DUF488 family)